MPNNSGTQTADLLAALRRALRGEGWTIRKLADKLEVGEATVKRWLAGKGLAVRQFEALAELADLSFAELAELAGRPQRHLAQELTLAQETALSEDSLLSFLFMAIVGGETWNEFAADFGIPETQIEAALVRLEKLALIDRLPGGRARSLVDRTILWRKTPLRARFETAMKPQFLAMDFAALDAVYASEVFKLSKRGAAALAEMIERHRREVHRLAESDRRDSLLPRRWHAVLFAARRLDTNGLKVSMP